MIECIKNIECCDCPEMGSCATYAQNKLFKEFFMQYGTYREEYHTQHLYLSAEHPSNIYTLEGVQKYIKRADDNITELQKYIDMMQAYKMELVKRYNYILTVPTKEKILLKRHKQYRGNVYYYIIFISVNLETGEETETDRKTYKGSERKQAFADFEKIAKEHKNAIIQKDIEKSRFEK